MPAEVVTQITTARTIELVAEFSLLHSDDWARGKAAALAEA